MLLWIPVCFLMSLTSVAVYLRFATRLPFVDRPNERSAHVQNTLSSGGLAIMFALLTTTAVAVVSSNLSLPSMVCCALVPALLICGIGAIDDWRSLPAALRLVGFFAFCAWAGYLFFQPSTIYGGALLLLIVIALVWLVNLFNFMDGVDGLAAIQCVLVSAGLAILVALESGATSFPWFAGMIASAYAGFLVFNWPPAKLFMGDAGSLPAGFLLGVLGLWLWRDGVVPVYTWFILMSPFLLDTGFTLLRRYARGESVIRAHSEHIYQRLTRKLGSPLRTNMGLVVLQLIWLFPLSYLCAAKVAPGWTILTLALFPQLFLIAKYYRLQ